MLLARGLGRWDMHDPRVVGRDRVLVVTTQRGRLRGTDSWVELHYGMVATVAEGRVSRYDIFATPAKALASVGLRA